VASLRRVSFGRHEKIAAVAFGTGMRPIEIYKLKRQNVNFEKGYLRIIYGKTKSSNRKVWLADKALVLLKNRSAFYVYAEHKFYY
jgi:integrase